MDGAFFSDRIIDSLEQAKVEYTISVPFERFAKLKTLNCANYKGDGSGCLGWVFCNARVETAHSFTSFL
jgi:hypothetical protein